MSRRRGRPLGATSKPEHLRLSELLHLRTTPAMMDALCRRALRGRSSVQEVSRAALDFALAHPEFSVTPKIQPEPSGSTLGAK